ncbi:cytochrome c3 family protein [Calderihabitans maritimus]|uniref:Uncharacterized protein n=1 Tax=Calderihabitans maritimus TaxID=1246530 RepID=A0A1Z5HW95_9FIRM|nr:cytochrome c3 family protein [Calderihabitans maritimus]GAW93585.1 hypothetical protein TherJR_2096 [Calderihabitans maritimus]
MKKIVHGLKLLLSGLTVGLLMVLLFNFLYIGRASASTRGPHDPYVNEEVCRNCHTIWSYAQKGYYDRRFGSTNDIYNTCVYCHNSRGQSRYDVINGVIYDPNGNGGNGAYYRTEGGGFSKWLVRENVSSLNGNLTDVTSVHDVKGTGDLYAPGGNTSLAGAFTDFSCDNCHDPHGRTNNSRILRDDINGVTGVSATLIVNNELKDESVIYLNGFNEFCGSCHTDFRVTEAGAGDHDSGIYTSFKRHRVGMDPAGYPGYNPDHGLPLESGKVSCMTCHYAHSTAVKNEILFDRADNYNGSRVSASSTLLRRSNRGVCQACHSK